MNSYRRLALLERLIEEAIFDRCDSRIHIPGTNFPVGFRRFERRQSRAWTSACELAGQSESR
jgi:hypothetical protein